MLGGNGVAIKLSASGLSPPYPRATVRRLSLSVVIEKFSRSGG